MGLDIVGVPKLKHPLHQNVLKSTLLSSSLSESRRIISQPLAIAAVAVPQISKQPTSNILTSVESRNRILALKRKVSDKDPDPADKERDKKKISFSEAKP